MSNVMHTYISTKYKEVIMEKADLEYPNMLKFILAGGTKLQGAVEMGPS